MSIPTPKSTQQLQNEVTEFDLQTFLPYLVRVFYTHVSSAVAQSYAPSFGLTPSEWRTLAVLGPGETLSASDIVDRSSITRVHVSRAIKSLQKRGLIRRDIDGLDKRKASVRMTPDGIETYKGIIAPALEVEQALVKDLTEEDILHLISTMSKINQNAKLIGAESNWDL
ncbi:MAG: DNA-binding MarR family transcriptional regulator [Candidatus Azotimanducaceae bacterium]|jgi:DNA-binding MarR family transcriptional regulator